MKDTGTGCEFDTGDAFFEPFTGRVGIIVYLNPPVVHLEWTEAIPDEAPYTRKYTVTDLTRWVQAKGSYGEFRVKRVEVENFL